MLYLLSLSFSLFCKFWWMIRVIRITYKYFSKSMNLSELANHQTYFECYEFDDDVVFILIATCTYKSMLNWQRMNHSSWISILLTHTYSKFHKYLWVAKKRPIANLWHGNYVNFEHIYWDGWQYMICTRLYL